MRLVKILPLAIILAIAGCKEPSLSDAPSNMPAIEAYQGLSQLTPNERGTVYLSPFVVSGSQTQVKLTDVKLLSDREACQAPLSKDDFSMQFDTKIDGSAICDYKYTVTATNKDSTESLEKSSTISVVSSASLTPILTPIPYSIELDDDTPTASIKIDDELSNVGDVYPSGYILSDDYVLLGDGNVTIDSNLRTIRYTAVSEGPHRIIYKLEDPIGSEHRFGSIDIAVSDGSHTKPVVDNAAYPDPVEPGEEIIIDVEPYVTSPSGHDLQLVYVNSFNATVSPNAPGELTNTEFKFFAPLSGNYYVAFMVSDHYGGFGSGIMKVSVVDPNQKPKWSNIYFDSNWYLAPITSVEAEQQSVDYSGVFLDSGYSPAIEMAIFGEKKASKYCNSRGRMPLASELLDLYQSETPGGIHNWPVELPYWAEHNGAAALVDLKTGEQPEHFSQGYYVTCVIDESMANITISPIKGTATADGIDSVQVEATYSVLGKPMEGVLLSASISGRAVLDDNTGVTNAEGKVPFNATNTKAETVSIKIESVSQDVSFIGDKNTADMYYSHRLRNNSVADGVAVNVMRIRVRDANNNYVPNLLIKFTSDIAQLVENPETLITDENGMVEASFTSDTGGKVDITAAYSNEHVHTEATLDFWYVEKQDIVIADDLMFHRGLTVSEAEMWGAEGGMYDTPFISYGVEYGLWAYNWRHSACRASRMGGYTNWRLPNIEEYKQFVDILLVGSDPRDIYLLFGWPIHVSNDKYHASSDVTEANTTQGLGKSNVTWSVHHYYGFLLVGCVRNI